MNLIFCDESCHLQNDGSDIMVLGGIKCPANHKSTVYNDLVHIKEKYGLNKKSEIKWTKISKKYEEMYKEIIDYVMQNDVLKIRIVLVTGKRDLDHKKFEQTHDDWYYKIYYTLLGGTYSFANNSKVFLDIKDTCGGSRIKELKKFLNYNNKVFGVYQVRSNESELLQVTDLLIGMTSYYRREKKKEIPKINNTKQNLISYFREKYHNLENNTKLNQRKFNFFNWDSHYGGNHGRV